MGVATTLKTISMVVTIIGGLLTVMTNTADLVNQSNTKTEPAKAEPAKAQPEPAKDNAE